MDIEWAKDGIHQSIVYHPGRPETVHSQKNPLIVKEYKIINKGKVIDPGRRPLVQK